MIRSLLLPFLLLATPLAAEPLSPVKAAELSARLYDAGRDSRDALLLIAAARLRKSITPEPSDRTAEGAAPAPGAPLGWDDMLAAATDAAAGDEILLGLIEDLRAEGTKGVVKGPVYNIGSVGAKKTDRYPAVDFKGGEYAEVYVEASSSADLNLTVLDAQGRLVCSDSDASHVAYCGWRPAVTGGFQLIVENRGAATSYALMTN